MWNRYDYPTVNDADEGGDILILRNNGRKSIYNWEDFCDEKLLAKDIGWMSLPQSDIPQPRWPSCTWPFTITISSGGRSFTIVMVDGYIEVYDSRDPMGQPMILISEKVDDLEGVLLIVESILEDGFIEAPDDDDDATYQYNDGEPVAVNDTELQGFIDAIRGKTPEPKPKTWPWSR